MTQDNVSITFIHGAAVRVIGQDHFIILMISPRKSFPWSTGRPSVASIHIQQRVL